MARNCCRTCGGVGMVYGRVWCKGVYGDGCDVSARVVVHGKMQHHLLTIYCQTLDSPGVSHECFSVISNSHE
jgi:hypothetical protein